MPRRLDLARDKVNVKGVGLSTFGLNGRRVFGDEDAGMMFRIEADHIELLALDNIVGFRLGVQLLGDGLALALVYINVPIHLRRRSDKKERERPGGVDPSRLSLRLHECLQFEVPAYGLWDRYVAPRPLITPNQEDRIMVPGMVNRVACAANLRDMWTGVEDGDFTVQALHWPRGINALTALQRPQRQNSIRLSGLKYLALCTDKFNQSVMGAGHGNRQGTDGSSQAKGDCSIFTHRRSPYYSLEHAG